MFALEDTVRQLSILFLLTCFRSNCADEILIQTFRNVGSNGSVPNVILQQLNRTDKLQCCLRCIEMSGCLMLGVLPQRKCLLLGDHVEGTRNQSVIEEEDYVIYYDPYIKSEYTVITQTGAEIDSETECMVYLNVFGENGMSKQLYLDHPGREMARGTNDTFTFHGNKNLGKFTKMQLQVLPYGVQGGWLVIGVEVKRERVHQHYRHFDSYYSYLNKWYQSVEIGLSFITSFLAPSQTIDFKQTSDSFEKLGHVLT